MYSVYNSLRMDGLLKKLTGGKKQQKKQQKGGEGEVPLARVVGGGEESIKLGGEPGAVGADDVVGGEPLLKIPTFGGKKQQSKKRGGQQQSKKRGGQQQSKKRGGQQQQQTRRRRGGQQQKR